MTNPFTGLKVLFGQGVLFMVFPLHKLPPTLPNQQSAGAPTMALRDEKTFSDEEFAAAFAFVLPEDQARREGVELNSMPDYKGFETATVEELRAAPVKSERSYDGDMLDSYRSFPTIVRRGRGN